MMEAMDKVVDNNLHDDEKLVDVKIGQKLIEVLDSLLNSDEWDSSLFLKTVKKRLQDLRANAYTAVDEGIRESAKIGKDFGTVQELPPGYIKVYILLYQTEGNKLTNWQYSIKSLVGHNVSRPTYREERYAQELIRSKKDAEHYGYAIIHIPEDGIYQFTQVSKDTLGHDMLMLKEGTVKLNNIEGFVHANKKRYKFFDGELIYEGETL